MEDEKLEEWRELLRELNGTKRDIEAMLKRLEGVAENTQRQALGKFEARVEAKANELIQQMQDHLETWAKDVMNQGKAAMSTMYGEFLSLMLHQMRSVSATPFARVNPETPEALTKMLRRAVDKANANEIPGGIQIPQPKEAKGR